jgi:hypothetical protein
MDLYLAEVMDKCNQLQQAHLAIGMILEFLPENILEKFSWHPWSSFSADNLLLLYKKQKRMKWLEGIALDRDILPEIQDKPEFDGIFSNVRKLGLYPDSREVLNMCHALLKRSPKIEKITLHASFEEDVDGAIPTRELNDSSTGPGLITSTVFSHLLPFEKCTPLALRDFTLQKVNLRYAADTYCRFIDFKTLKALRIFACSGADSLFAELSKSQKLPEKLETLEFKHDDNQENDALNALDGFLCLVSGIKSLTLDVCYAKTLPASAGIARHARTLKELNVHASRGDGEEEELVYDFDDFEKICKTCSQLEQLSVAFPPTSIIRSNSDQFTAFEVCCVLLDNAILPMPLTLSLGRPRRTPRPNNPQHNNLADQQPQLLPPPPRNIRNPFTIPRPKRFRALRHAPFLPNTVADLQTRRHSLGLLRQSLRPRGLQEPNHFRQGQADRSVWQGKPAGCSGRLVSEEVCGTPKRRLGF